MSQIHLLDNNTIDKIAAGEVVERPSSVVKELVENAIDAAATIITVEIKNGGLKLIRVTDNGSGIEPDQIRNAFCSHATSKIKDASDLDCLTTLGFRGEALSSIAAVSRTEVTTRVSDNLTGIHVLIEGGREEVFEEVGAPLGTTFLVRDIFYNTLPRLKFLKSETTEGNYIADLMEHLALSMPQISFQFINNGQTKFSTSGRNDLREVIYRIYGKETTENLREIQSFDSSTSMRISGFLGLPKLNRSNRSDEIIFINHRYVKSSLISRAVEEGYKEYLMQHKFPFFVINLEFDPVCVDVNVHPTKQEVRLSNEKLIYDVLVRNIRDSLTVREMLDTVTIEDKSREESVPAVKDISVKKAPELFEIHRLSGTIPVSAKVLPDTDDETEDDFFVDRTQNSSGLTVNVPEKTIADSIEYTPDDAFEQSKKLAEEYSQLELFDSSDVLTPETRKHYNVLGQLFKTYWLIEYEDTLLIMDQHAAHEKVNFERMMAKINSGESIDSQIVSPPEILSVSNTEKQVVFDNIDHFEKLGFTIDEFGEKELAIRAVPLDLYDFNPRDMVREIINDLITLKKSDTPDSIRYKIASMACKASVKGNSRMSPAEIEVLLDEMLTLDNPYNCPHGRPTIVTMTKQEMEKRFHRIV